MAEKEFVGRAAELAACLDRAAAVTVVEGRPGIGKTRLLAEVARRAPDPVCAVPGGAPEFSRHWRTRSARNRWWSWTTRNGPTKRPCGC